MTFLEGSKSQRNNTEEEVNRRKIQHVSLPIKGAFDMKALAAFWTRGSSVTGWMS